MGTKPPVKGDLRQSFSNHARRAFRGALTHEQIWGVPTEIIPFTRIEAMAPPELTREQIWKRPYSALSRREKDFYHLHAVKIWEDLGEKVKKKWKEPRELYEKVQSAFHNAFGPLNNVVSFVHYGNASSNNDGDILRNNTGAPLRDYAYVMIDDMHNADYMVESWISPAAFETVRPRNINDDAFHYWILQHEFAHISGAGESGADMMATAAYMREFKKDQIPRLMSDLRAVSTFSTLRALDRVSDTIDNPRSLKDRWPLRRRKLKKALKKIEENLTTYGWSCVEGIDRVRAKGVDHALKLDHDTILKLSKGVSNARNQLGLELVREVKKHAGVDERSNTLMSETTFARHTRSYLDELAKTPYSTLPEKARLKISIAQRYLTAVNRLLKREFEPEGGSMPSPRKARTRPFPDHLGKRITPGGPT